MPDDPEPSRTSEQRVQEASARRRALARQDLREKILLAATELFVTQGYDRFSMRQLAEQIGYSAATIYLHFANRDELLFALLDEGYNRFGAELAAVAETVADPLERISAIGRAYIAFGQANPMLYQLMFMRRADFLQARLNARDRPVDSFTVLQQAVQAALAANALPPGDVLNYSLALWSAVHGLTALNLMLPEAAAPVAAQAAETVLSALITGLQRS